MRHRMSTQVGDARRGPAAYRWRRAGPYLRCNSRSKLGYVLERLGTLGTLRTLRTLGIRRIGRLSWAFDDLFVL